MNTKTLLTLTLLTNLAQAEVNMKDGSYYKTWVDLEITKQNYTFQLRRTYDSRSLHPGIFGYGWCSDFEKSLEFRPGDEIVLRDCKLKTSIRYQKIKPTLFRSLQNPLETLEVKDTTYLRKTPSALQKYNQLGQLIFLSNHHGFHLQFQYGPRGSLHKININTFAEVTFQMDARGRHIQSVNYVGLPPITYKYKDLDLIKATNAWKGVFEYQYDDVHNLTKVIYPDATYEGLTYNKERDWILNVQTRDKCQETFQWTELGPRAQGKYKSSAKRTCRGQLMTQTKFEFSRTTKKIRTSAKGDFNNAN